MACLGFEGGGEVKGLGGQKSLSRIQGKYPDKKPGSKAPSQKRKLLINQYQKFILKKDNYINM
jgi:hypothetical protein